ncbi:adenylate/guanylate cyclase [Leptospira ryugenii]|uniref:Adenylate/guanylate cyclase n=1 Tax=Leptospira ryugenii TaxID=1917863 RepID=A0A2P2DZ46_9LEPT|nr:adenylate/guanylate cyclase domain-containing protein [Leptospira ryugenii]GBF49898.1 adenylate/guanylate cyclase [Leptospira ryugenii]
MIELKQLLAKYPWEDRWTKLGKPMDFLFEFDLRVTREEIWPFLIDTSSFNKRMELPKFSYEERNGVLNGKAKQIGMDLVWEEVPWEWEYLKEIANARIYSKGFAKYLRTYFILEPHGEERSKLFVYFGWIPRNIFMRLLLQFAVPTIKKDFLRTLAGIEEEIINQKSNKPKVLFNTAISFQNEFQWVHPEKLEESKRKFKEVGISETTTNEIIEYLKRANDNEIDRIRVKSISQLLDLDPNEVLKFFLYGCRFGIFTLSWDVICPHCRGVRTSVQKLGDMPPDDECEVCEIQFNTTEQNSIEVTFHMHPSVRVVEKQFFCAAEPNTKKHILLTKHVPAGKVFSSDLLIKNGLYRLRQKGKQKYHLVEVNESNLDKEIVWTEELGNQEIQVKPKPGIVFQNQSDEGITIVLEERKEDQNSLRPKELFNFNEFRDLFSEEAIATNLQLDIGVQTILFTDIVGSTRFYESTGDHGAFLQVREHFVKAYTIIREHKGTVVKTIGDAVMASFPAPLFAFKAAESLQGWFHNSNEATEIRIRVSIHSGNCLAVNLDSNIDYFGNTVNYAAKMQGVTGSGEVSISETVFRDNSIRNYLKEKEMKLKKIDFPLSWTERTDTVYIWKS